MGIYKGVIHIGFRNGAYATCWQHENKSDKWTKIRISVSRKNQDTNQYEEEFAGWVDCIGTACAQKAAKLRERDRIKLLKTDVRTSKRTDDGGSTKWFTNFILTDFEMADGSGSSGKPQQSSAKSYEGENDPSDNGDLPF